MVIPFVYTEEEYKKLEEENRNLKSELSKFRDSFKKYRDYEKEELAESCYDLARENEKLKDIIGKIVYLYKEEPTELEEYVKSWFKWWMSN